MEYSEDHINRILWRDSAWQSALMASIFKSSADSLYRCTVYSCNMCLRDRIGDSCAGCAIYSGRKSDSAYSDPDRRTWNHCMYNCIFNSGWKKNKYEEVRGNIDKELGTELKAKLKEEGISIAEWITNNAKKYLKK